MEFQREGPDGLVLGLQVEILELLVVEIGEIEEGFRDVDFDAVVVDFSLELFELERQGELF